jgi:hypothetical protein
MQESLLNSLCAQRSAIHARWDTLLRTERVTTPLAYPDALVHLIEWALDQIFTSLRDPVIQKKAEHAGGRAAARPECPCGRNPLLAFFLAGEQALLEALVLEQASHQPIDPSERDTGLNQLYYVIRAMARREVDAFCSVCQYRQGRSATEAPCTGSHTHGQRGDAKPLADDRAGVQTSGKVAAFNPSH